MNKYKRELSDTEALVRQGIRSAHPIVAADDWSRSSLASADNAVSSQNSGQFRRETGAGNESLSKAAKVAEGEC